MTNPMPPIYTLGHLAPLLEFDEPVAIWEWGKGSKLRIKQFFRIVGDMYCFSFLSSDFPMHGHFVCGGSLVIRLRDFLGDNQIENLCLMWKNGGIEQKDFISDLLHSASNLEL